MAEKMQRIVLARRPEGHPTHENFRLEEMAMPSPGAGEMLIRVVWLTLDPYMRGQHPALARHLRRAAGGFRGPGRPAARSGQDLHGHCHTEGPERQRRRVSKHAPPLPRQTDLRHQGR